ncbi:MAG: hypothetical protein JWN31_260 [Frankiales bacterium]|nr:hypothetical protein [Frankiales bacterium]
MNRYGVMTRFDWLKLLLGYLLLQVIAWLFFSALAARFAIAVISAAVLAVAVTTRRRTGK